jgi:hypothetical protein
MNPIQKRETPTVDLTNECFPQFVSREEREELLAGGCLINVTAWVHRSVSISLRQLRYEISVVRELEHPGFRPIGRRVNPDFRGERQRPWRLANEAFGVQGVGRVEDGLACRLVALKGQKAWAR